jgi:hypothetical protein
VFVSVFSPAAALAGSLGRVCSEFRLLRLIGGCSGEAERGGGVAAPHGGGGRRARPAGGAVRGGVPPRPPQRPDPLRRAQPGPPGRRPEGKRSSCSLICPVRSGGRCHRVLTVPVVPRARLQVVVNTAADSVLQADGAALSAFQYFENVRNFLVAAQEIGLPCFEASDLEQVRFGARGGGAPPPGFACSCSNLSPHRCFLHTHSRGGCDLDVPFCLSGRREGRAPGW